MSFRQDFYVYRLKQYMLEHGIFVHDTLIYKDISTTFADRPLLTEQLVVGSNIDYLGKPGSNFIQKLYLRLKLDLQVMLDMYSQQLLRWEILSQVSEIWKYIKRAAEECRISVSEVYKRGVETILLPSLALRYKSDQILFKNCVLPLKDFEIQDIQYTQDPYDFKLNQPLQNIKSLKLTLYGWAGILVFDINGAQTIELIVKYTTEKYEYKHTVTQTNQIVFKPYKQVEYIRISQPYGLAQVYQLKSNVEDVAVQFFIGRPHVQPTHAEYTLSVPKNDDSQVTCVVTGLQTDSTIAGTGSTVQLDLSNKDPQSICVLYGKYNASAQYLTGQHAADTGFVQYQVWNGEPVPEGVEQYVLHSLTEEPAPKGLCVLRFKDIQTLTSLNQNNTTYQYMSSIFA